MKAVKVLVIVAAVYVGIVVAFEVLVTTMGQRQADQGVGPDENWLVLTTTGADGGAVDTVIAGVEVADALYVSANHWPRGWYRRALERPDVEIVRRGTKALYRAVPVDGDERARAIAGYRLPWIIRLLSGFPPRSFLRMDPR
ncbi:MAG TPA: nitroreductase/quinone reductase family protein [Pseudomonadales bacterium]